MTDPQDLITIYHAANVMEAHLVKNLMLEAGIDARVSEENEPLAGLGIATSDVLIHQSDFAQAENIVEQYEERQVQRVEGPGWKCKACGATNYAGYDSCDTCGAARPKS
jgi:rubrerythrin